MRLTARPKDTDPKDIPDWTWDAGVDWVTFIARTAKGTAELREAAAGIEHDYGDRAAKTRPFHMGGYEGWSTPTTALGYRGVSSLLRLSGTVAAEAWTKLQSCTGQPTRLDLQASLTLSEPRPSFGLRFLRLSSAAAAQKSSCLPRSGLRTDSKGLWLGTVGDRTKSRYLRVYDKGIESNTQEAGLLWRTELEAKGALAPALWASLQKASDTRMFSAACVEQAWRRSGCSWPLRGFSKTRMLPRVPSRPSPDGERLLLWLQTSVNPAIQRLLRTHPPAEILRALGLTHPTTNHDQ